MTGASLEAFFVYSEKLGTTEETEAEKLLLYWPSGVAPDDRLSNVGICQGIAGFARELSAGQLCTAIRTGKRRIALYSPDPDIWMVMMCTLSGEEPSDGALQSVLQQAYRMFKLFHGGFQYTLDNFNVRTLRDKLELFFPPYLEKLDIGRLQFFNALDGITFLPVDKTVYLQIYCFVQRLEHAFPAVRQCMVLFDDLLVWSGLEQDDARTLYRFLIDTPPRTPFTGFRLGPQTDADDAPLQAPMVHVGSAVYRLAVFQLQRAAVALLLERGAGTEAALFRALATHCESEGAALVKEMGEQYDRARSVRDEFRYIYFNHMNLALKSSLRKTQLPSETLALVQAVHEDFMRGEPDGIREVCIRHNDGWLVGRRNGQREFFVLFDRKDASLVQVGDDVNRMCETYFSNIYLE